MLLDIFRPFRKIAKSDYSLRNVCPSVQLSVCPPVRLSICPSVRIKQLGSHWTDFHEIRYLKIFRKSVGEIRGSLKWTRLKGTLREEQCKFFIISCSFRLRMRNVADKI